MILFGIFCVVFIAWIIWAGDEFDKLPKDDDE
jgi:hypothetical protein